MTKRKTKAQKRKTKQGRPTVYPANAAAVAYSLALLGATDEQIAAALGVAESTLYNWRKTHPDFLESIKKGREPADGAVAASLYQRATGYSHDAVKIFADPKTGAEKIVKYIERYPPDSTAMIFWLKNRRPDLWRDQQHIRISDLDALSDAELEALAAGKAPKS